MRPLAIGTGAAGALAGLYAAVVRGQLTVDVGVGRRVRDLGPQVVRIAAPRDLVFAVVAGPYRRTPRAMRDKLDVLERSEAMVLAAHHTRLDIGLVATTVETVRFEPPSHVHFRLVRGPVPHVVETFALESEDGGTRLTYSGELGTDFWAVGARWGDRVAAAWERAVAVSLRQIRDEAERRACASRACEDGRVDARPDELIARFYEAFARRDGAAMAAFYAPDATFRDPVFGELTGSEAGAMWRMLTGRADDLQIDLVEHAGEGTAGTARWIAQYTFTQTGRPVVNDVRARFRFDDAGRIAEHVDEFSFHRWAQQALGSTGWLLGWTPWLRARVRAQARAGLSAFSHRPA